MTDERERSDFMELSLAREANSSLSNLEIPPNFMEPEGCLSCLQQPATCPYPEPDQFPNEPKQIRMAIKGGALNSPTL